MKNTIIENTYVNLIRLSKMQENFYIQQNDNLTLTAFFNKLGTNQIDDNICLFKIYDKLQELKLNLNFFKDMIDDTSFIKQVFKFYNDTIKYNIDITKLDETSLINKEIKTILLNLLDLNTSTKSIESILSKSKDFSLVQIDSNVISDLYNQKITNYLISNNATIYPVKQNNVTNMEFIRSVNIRQEIENVAQYICNNNLKADSVNIVLCNYAKDIEIFNAIFERYRIPTFSIINNETSLVAKSYLAILNFLNNPNCDSLINAINSSFYESKYINDFNLYFDLFIEDISILNNEFCHVVNNIDSEVFKYEYDRYIQLEKNANIVRKEILLLFQQCSNNYLRAYDIICDSRLASINIFEDEIVALKRIIEKYYPYTSMPKYNNIIISFIKSINKVNNQIIKGATFVTDLKNPIEQNVYAFVIGCTQKNYPNFSGNSGVFDEDYCNTVTNYPSLADRQKFNLNYLSWIYSCGEHIQFSYALSNYEGKHLDPSIEIASMLQNIISDSNIISNHYINDSVIDNLDSDVANKLFFNDNALKGSVSRFERYFNCPFSFYLQYGLKLNKSDLKSFDIANLGTIQHLIMEKLTKKYGKQYANCDNEELYELITNEFTKYEKLYIKDLSRLDIIKKRCFINLQLVLKHLSEMEDNSQLIPTYSEFEFKDTIYKDDQVMVQIKGIIDRIDMNADITRIIDYKSSSKKLVKNSVISGIQLQLLTYMYVLVKQQNSKPCGIYYVPMSYKDISMSFASLNLRAKEISENVECDHEDIFYKNNKINGWHFLSTDLIDSSARFFKSINKEGLPSNAYIKNIDGLEKHINYIYKYLVNEIKNGSIKCTPVLGACDYCDYKSICRFNSMHIKSIISPQEQVDAFAKSEEEDEV